MAGEWINAIYYVDNALHPNPWLPLKWPTYRPDLIRDKDLYMYGRLPDYEEITPNSDRAKSTWKSFEHYKCFVTTKPEMLDVRITSGLWVNSPAFHTSIVRHPHAGFHSSLGFGDAARLNTGLPPLYLRRLSDNGFVPEPANLNELRQMSMQTMMPLIKSELSLVNSLLELRELKSLPNTVRNAVAAINRLPVHIRRVRKTLALALRGNANGYLQYKFNLLPLLSDISGIRTALSRLDRQLNDLISRAGRPQNKHFAYNWDEYPSVQDETSDFLYEGRELRLKRLATHSSSTFHAQIQYNYNYTGYQIANAQLLGLLDSFGVNFNPSIIWNAIPWSFVVDWVAGVGRFLDQFKTMNMEPKINIHRYLWSIKRSRDILVTRSFSARECANVSFGESTNLPAVREESYRRQVEQPTVSQITIGGVSSQELTLGAALVIARRRRSK